jgi:trans-aconitate 2-methyltransferase
VATRPEFADALQDLRFSAGVVVETPVGYAELLTDAGCAVDVWETTYIHELTGETPVFDWISGTALTEVRARLSEDAWADYRSQLIPRLAELYPVRADGRTFFAFRRLFVVARVP